MSSFLASLGRDSTITQLLILGACIELWQVVAKLDSIAKLLRERS
jgi:hypothetical protein